MLDGKPLFSLSSLLQYRKNSLDVESALLSKVEDRSVREMILEMVALDPSRRPSIDECLGRWRSSVFPEWFYSPLYPELLDVGSALPQGPSGAGGPDKNALLATHGSPATVISVSELDGLGSDEAPGILLHTSDGRIAKLYNRWPVLAPLLSLYPGLHIDESVAIHDLAGPHDAAVILLSFVLSYVRNCAYPSSRRHGLEIILSLSHSLDDSVIMDRVVPLVTSMATRDEAAFVRASAIFALRVLLLNVDEIRPVDAKVFDDYLIPQLNHMATDPEPMVRIALSRTIADFLETAYRIAGMTDDT
ncbi:Serine/threonine-protein kinase, partial [Spiromyces aspiralis]